MARSLGQSVGLALRALPRKRRLQLAMLLALMFGSAIAEVLSLGAILPFLAILVDPVRAMQTPILKGVLDLLALDTVADPRWHLTVLFGGAALAAGAMRFALIYATARTNYRVGHDLGREIYRRTLYQPYEVHVSRSSSEILGGIAKVDEVVIVISALLNMMSASLLALFILVTLLVIDASLATIVLVGLGAVYAAVFAGSRRWLVRNSEITNAAYGKRVEVVQEGLGSIRDVLLDHAQPVFERRFIEVDSPMRDAQASNNIIGPSPRVAVEALGIALIAALAYAASMSEGGLLAALPALGALALGAQRLLPLVQQSYHGWVMVSANSRVLNDVADLLQQPVDSLAVAQTHPLALEREIRFEQARFRYGSDLPDVLHGLTLSIPKGARVGICGPTGSGKSTAMDLLLGLLEPTQGSITVDGVPLTGAARYAWQRNVAHVPQSIYLAAASFTENIAFGVSAQEADMALVRQAAREAQIADFIESSTDGYATMVGERGARLSGGQRQRIGIARALYKQAKVLVFDEATSSLDTETEAAVMHAIASLGREYTVVLIAHRLSTLRGCDLIYRLEDGRVVFTGDYRALVAAGAGEPADVAAQV